MTTLDVKVETGADSFEVETGYILKARLTEPPENGRANTELIRELGKILGKEPGIIRGHSSQRKKLKVDMPEERVEQKLEQV